MNKELFVSSTPHETKVGLVEDDLLAEIYLERENEYTLAGSIYKGRVTRVLPGMQSAFVDIGLERDAFLYVSDFMELEEHDEDLTDIVPANRGVQDLRAQPARGESAPAAVQSHEGTDAVEPEAKFENGSGQELDETEPPAEAQPSLAAATPETSGGGLLKTASGEAGGDGAVVVADVAMDEATLVARGVSGDRSRVLPGLRSRVLLLRRFLVRRSQAGPSSSDRQRDTSPCCFRESRFPSTGD